MPRKHAMLFGLDESGATEYRCSEELEFLELLHDRSSKAKWFADGWARNDRTIVTVTVLNEPGNAVHRTLRIDFFDDHVVVGYDSTHQLVDELDVSLPGVRSLHDATIREMATFAANWIETELAQRE